MTPNCPYGFEAMNQKVTDMHVQEKHKEELEKAKRREGEEGSKEDCPYKESFM